MFKAVDVVKELKRLTGLDFDILDNGRVGIDASKITIGQVIDVTSISEYSFVVNSGRLEVESR